MICLNYNLPCLLSARRARVGELKVSCQYYQLTKVTVKILYKAFNNKENLLHNIL